MQLGQQ